MTTLPQRLIAIGLLYAVLSSSPGCKSKPQPEQITADSAANAETREAGSPEQLNPADNHLDELMKLPDAKATMDNYVFRHIRDFPEEAFDLQTPRISVERPNNNLFEVTAEFTGTAKTDLYTNPIPQGAYDEEKKTFAQIIVTELLESKGNKKTVVTKFQVRYGPMNRGRHPDKVIWNWENPKTTGDNMENYVPGGPYRWASAEHFKINSEGTASADPFVIIRGTPGYDKALVRFPSFAKDEAKRIKQEEAEKRYREVTKKMEEDSKNEEERKRNLIDKALKQ